jgi:hypothetical protein
MKKDAVIPMARTVQVPRWIFSDGQKNKMHFSAKKFTKTQLERSAKIMKINDLRWFALIIFNGLVLKQALVAPLTPIQTKLPA